MSQTSTSRPGFATRLKYRILSELPGKRGARYLRKLSRLRHDEVTALFARAMGEAQGGICIDLGANMGLFTEQMAQVAKRVYAFEPDPWTADQLRQNVGHLDGVEVIEAAAGVEEGSMPIYRSAKFDTDPQKGSLSSTLIAEKTNVGDTETVHVKVVDFCRFLRELDSDIALLKVDIEGAEVALLEALLDDPVCQRIAYIFVETHETKVPSLVARSKALRRRVRHMTRPIVDMDWQ